MAAATTAAAAASPAGGATGRSRGAAVTCRGENGKLDRRFFAGALGAGDFLLLVDHDFFELRLASVADVFIDRHNGSVSNNQTVIVPQVQQNPRDPPEVYPES